MQWMDFVGQNGHEPAQCQSNSVVDLFGASMNREPPAAAPDWVNPIFEKREFNFDLFF